MKIKLSLNLFIFLLAIAVYAQDNVGIGTLTPDASAILDLSSTNKGLLPPRMTATQRDGITNPATGLVVYNTTDSRYEYNSGTPVAPVWTVMSANVAISLNMPTQFAVTGSPATSNGTFGVSWASQTQNQVFASPDGSNGTPTFRVLSANDIPDLSAAKITSGTLGVPQGGTGVATITGMLKGNGTSAFSGVTATAGKVTYWADNNTIAGVNDLTYDATNAILTFDGTFRHSPQASAPSSPSAGMTYYNSTNNKLYLYNGSSWVDLAETGGGGGGNLPSGTNSQTLRYDDTNLVATSLLRVTSTNVGIGDDFTPNSLLHTDAGNNVASYHKFTAGTATGRTATDGFDIGIDASNRGIIKNYEDQSIIFATKDTTRMVVNGGLGGVQILTSYNSGAVNALNLHNAGSTSIAMAITNGATGNTTSDGLRIGISGNGTAEINQKENQSLSFKVNNNEILKLDSSNSNRAKLLFNTSTIPDTINAKFGGNVNITGNLIVDGYIDPISLTLMPQNGTPSFYQEGTMYYSQSDKKLRVYNGSDWSPIATEGASKSRRLSVQTKTSNYTLDASDDVILCGGSSNFTLNLPSAVGLEGKVYHISCKYNYTGAVTIKAQTGQNIESSNEKVLSADNAIRMTIVSDGSNWYIISSDN